MKHMVLLGGSFDPIHKGHIQLLLESAAAVKADGMLLMPAADPPHKSGKPMTPFVHRLAMCQLAAKGKGVQVSDLESRRAGKSYTVDTLRALQELFSDTQWSLVCGSDMFLTLQDWRQPKEIFRMASIVATARAEEKNDVLKQQAAALAQMGARVTLVQLHIPPFSSTAVREALYAGQPVRDMLDPAVEQYIRDHGLYTNGKKEAK